MKQSKKVTLLAKVISRVFDPMVEIPLLMAATAYIALTNGARFRFLILLGIVNGLFPALFVLFGLKTGRISDIDMTKRSERVGPYVFTLICHFFSLIYALMIGKTFLAAILAVFWGLAVIFALVTIRWKISVHTGVNAALVAFANHFYGWNNYWWLLIVLVLVLWSRVSMKKHTLAQAIVGAIVALVWVELGLRFFGLRAV